MDGVRRKHRVQALSGKISVTYCPNWEPIMVMCAEAEADPLLVAVPDSGASWGCMHPLRGFRRKFWFVVRVRALLQNDHA